MKTLKIKKTALILSVLFAFVSAFGQDKETKRLNESSEVLTALSQMKESIPHELLEKYEGVVIIPKLINAGIGVGAKRGKGIAMVKLADGRWGNPVFITLTGGSVGFQIGVQSVDLVLVFKNSGVLTEVKNGDFTIGADASVAAGPLGRSTSAGTDHKLEAEIYSYSRSRGVFAGISINGSVLSIDKKSNANFYGKDVASKTIFDTSESADKAVKNLKATLTSI